MGSSTLSAGLAQPPTKGNALAELLDPVAAELAQVEEALTEQVRGFDPEIHRYVRYILGGTGKRLRPSLVLLAGGATGRLGEGHRTLAVIVELIHIATLVHDDVLDESKLRRALPSANSLWGNEISVLLGDCLFAHALKLATCFPTTTVCRRISEAVNTVCAGEIVQTQRRFDLDLSLKQYFEILHMKTGALFAVSCELGAVLNGTPAGVVESLSCFGANLGIAYQIYDDCLDIFGREGAAGKSLGTDVKKGKLTLPFLLLLQGAQPENREKLAAMIFRDEPQDRRQLVSLVMENGVLATTMNAIEQYLERAAASLNGLRVSAHSQALSALPRYLSAQSRALLGEAETGL